MEFPAVAGVFLNPARRSDLIVGVPRGCGGVSELRCGGKASLRSSPRLRGCFCTAEEIAAVMGEFPAVAGVFLVGVLPFGIVVRVPRGCGGVW